MRDACLLRCAASGVRIGGTLAGVKSAGTSAGASGSSGATLDVAPLATAEAGDLPRGLRMRRSCPQPPLWPASTGTPPAAIVHRQGREGVHFLRPPQVQNHPHMPPQRAVVTERGAPGCSVRWPTM
ncbi:unnamed protein product [Lampetra fluviatilis]